jgi:hypothetical protein
LVEIINFLNIRSFSWDTTALQNAIDQCNNPNDQTGQGTCGILFPLDRLSGISCRYYGGMQFSHCQDRNSLEPVQDQPRCKRTSVYAPFLEPFRNSETYL